MGGKPEYCSAFPGSERTGVLPQILNAERLTYFHGSLYEGVRAGVVVTRRVRFLAPIPTFVHLRYE